ncbi:hypothetical protein C7402_103453 [Paraburkholderia unamae]|uniref:Uncharacterized protein n=1 Tax=Paraburkholderia unamae TaxID=219649 RepID=A0ABX5KXL4_9BURK|nr:hypothetical protein C7402_103453 [Paraburkholderia unamae]
MSDSAVRKTRPTSDTLLLVELPSGVAQLTVEVRDELENFFAIRPHKRMNHFAHAGAPADQARATEYEVGPYAGLGQQVQKAFAEIVPPDADVGLVAEAIVKVIGMPFGTRPFRVHIDPAEDGADVGFTVLDRVRAEMLHRVGLSDLLKPRVLK